MNKPLLELEAGQWAYILDLKSDNLCAEFFRKGCFPGDHIYVVENSPAHPYIVFRSGRYCYHLRRQRAADVITGPFSLHFCLN
ncbi:MAG: ferrous iron transport protein A [Chitinophagales bacterium]